jgi:hypothetical protein
VGDDAFDGIFGEHSYATLMSEIERYGRSRIPVKHSIKVPPRYSSSTVDECLFFRSLRGDMGENGQVKTYLLAKIMAASPCDGIRPS